GGGFIVTHEQAMKGEIVSDEVIVPYPFRSGDELLEMANKSALKIPQLIRENERVLRSDQTINQEMLHLWSVMDSAIQRGIRGKGVLPGGLNVQRRAFMVHEQIKDLPDGDPAKIFDWVSLWALAINEENAAGGRIVTAPTNGAAGVVPAVLKYYLTMTKAPTDQGVIDFLLTAGAMGSLFKLNASISAAEMGCMGEVGVACSMAAAGLTAALNGTNEQIENAAEIGMEHHLGLTCDPIKGLVQIPCIERNTMGAIQAINASRLALLSSERGGVTLDQVIATMRETGLNMKSIYKETSLGGLAVNVPEC
ncbi:L-serine ammonia-lyase, partial [Chlamydiales bacterium]|nr:L-serine ammonia-lyase [Chlamydiales bacterium]